MIVKAKDQVNDAFDLLFSKDSALYKAKDYSSKSTAAVSSSSE